MRIEQAVYGQVGERGHGLRQSSDKSQLAGEIYGRLDLPDGVPSGVQGWSPFVRGFPVADRYVIAKTFLDPSACPVQIRVAPPGGTRLCIPYGSAAARSPGTCSHRCVGTTLATTSSACMRATQTSSVAIELRPDFSTYDHPWLPTRTRAACRRV